MKKLNELYNCNYDIEIKGIKINSKEVEEGDIFVCTTGVTADRHDYIDDAVAHGASALVVSRDVDAKIPYIKVEDTNKELPLLASRFYDHPEEELKLIAVTGTNGKTTVAEVVQDLLGNDICGYIGTNGLSCSNFHESIRNTTPDSDRMYKYLRRLRDNGCSVVSLETSSEAFYRKRLTNFSFDVGILTNITEDHLNIHKTIDNYIECKCDLFRQIKKDGYAILNVDDNNYERVRSCCNCNILTYGTNDSNLRIVEFNENVDGTFIKVNYNNKDYSFKSPLLGEFNVYNLCAAILVLISMGKTMEEIIPLVDRVKVVGGRCESLEFGQNYSIILDYAHTKDSLDKILKFLNKIKKNRIITVTGSAGGREHEKRPGMGEIVLNNSDWVIFTMDDPRNEDVNEIIDEMIGNSTNTNYEKIVDRTQAIHKACRIAEEGDIILIAGKGRDNYMAVGNEYLPYSDYDEVEKYFLLS